MWLCFWFEFVFSFFFVGFHSLGIFGFVCVCFRVVFYECFHDIGPHSALIHRHSSCSVGLQHHAGYTARAFAQLLNHFLFIAESEINVRLQ